MNQNKLYTFHYHQPKEYRFSLDSIFLAQICAHYIEEKIQKKTTILDLCAGTGVIGLEMMIHLQKIPFGIDYHFIEVQNLYLQHFDKNCLELAKLIPRMPRYFYHLINYHEIKFDENFCEQYDYIVCNPPYFFKGEGILSPSDFKNRCRFFIDSTFEELIHALYYSLKNSGEAFILVRPGHHHGKNLIEMAKSIVGDKMSVEFFDEIRGTHVVKLQKIA